MIKILATNIGCKEVPLGKYTVELETRGLIFSTIMLFIADRVIGYRSIEDMLIEWSDIKFLSQVNDVSAVDALKMAGTI